MEMFIEYIRGYIPISDEIAQDIMSYAVQKKYDKGELLVEEGKTCKSLHFLQKGSVRSYIYLKGKDITGWVYGSNSIFTSWGSYTYQKPSHEYIETTDECEIISISHENWEILFEKHPTLERFGRLAIEQQIGLLDDFYKGYYFLSAKEKYELLIYAFPRITQIANLGHIASMLGISQETLSRIRGK